jgi:hypothetical protein
MRQYAYISPPQSHAHRRPVRQRVGLSSCWEEFMHRLLVGAFAVLASAAVATTAHAQRENILTVTCYDLGPSVQEPMPGAPGRALLDSPQGCSVHGTVLDRAPASVYGIWEMKGDEGVRYVGFGVIRSPTAKVVYEITEGKLNLKPQQGSLISEASGAGRFRIASGDVATLEGKTFTWVERRIRPGTAIIDIRYKD